MKHTLGPWKRKPGICYSVNVVTSDGKSIASADVGRDECEENARLIAASPELLAALQLFVDTCDSAPPVELVQRIGDACQNARAAIRKAEGEES
jgi:hypothetical protein